MHFCDIILIIVIFKCAKTKGKKNVTIEKASRYEYETRLELVKKRYRLFYVLLRITKEPNALVTAR